jgi:TolA-binding protein
MRARVKISKKEMKQDKFTTMMLQIREWLGDRWQTVVLGAAIVIVVIVAIVYYNNMQSGKEVTGAARLTMAISEARRQNFDAAITELSSISDEFGGKIGGQALFSLANTQYESRNYDDAMESYQRYLNKYRDNKYYTSSANAGIAACLENKQDFHAAGEKYREAIKSSPDSPSEPDYYLAAVRCYVMDGDAANTELMLNELKEKYANTDYARNATIIAMKLITN